MTSTRSRTRVARMVAQWFTHYATAAGHMRPQAAGAYYIIISLSLTHKNMSRIRCKRI